MIVDNERFIVKPGFSGTGLIPLQIIGQYGNRRQRTATQNKTSAMNWLTILILPKLTHVQNLNHEHHVAKNPTPRR